MGEARYWALRVVSQLLFHVIIFREKRKQKTTIINKKSDAMYTSRGVANRGSTQKKLITIMLGKIHCSIVPLLYCISGSALLYSILSPVSTLSTWYCTGCCSCCGDCWACTVGLAGAGPETALFVPLVLAAPVLALYMLVTLLLRRGGGPGTGAYMGSGLPGGALTAKITFN